MKINQLQIEIDGIDKEILRDLMEDARKPILQIANKIGIAKQMSVTKKPVLARIRISFISAIPAPPLSVEGYVPPPPDPPIYKVSREYLNI